MVQWLLAVVVIALWSSWAWAAKKPALPKPDRPGHWRIITTKDATTTSKCLGNASDLICAFETDLACEVRYLRHRGTSSCWREWADEEVSQSIDHENSWGTPFYKVRIVGIRYATEGENWKAPVLEIPSLRSTDVVIEFLLRDCGKRRSGKVHCITFEAVASYAYRWENGEWVFQQADLPKG